MSAPLELPPSTDSVPRARRYVREQLAAGDASVDIATATLLVSELVTNGVLHARTPLIVTVHNEGGLVRLGVHDQSGVSPRLHGFSSTSATGRGLRLLESLAKRWGIEPDPDGTGKTVWCEVAPTAEATWAAEHGDDSSASVAR